MSRATDVTSKNGHLTWDSANPSLILSDGRSNFTIDFINHQHKYWSSLNDVFDKLMDHINDYENSHPSTFEGVQSLFYRELYDEKDINGNNGAPILSISYVGKYRLFEIGLISHFGDCEVALDFNHEDTWETFVKIHTQMKRDYIKFCKLNTIDGRTFVDVSFQDNGVVDFDDEEEDEEVEGDVTGDEDIEDDEVTGDEDIEDDSDTDEVE